MTTLTNMPVQELIKRAVCAGNKRPSVAQLKTLAQAVGSTDAYKFLQNISLSDRIAVKNYCTAALVFGKAPESVSEGTGTAFGMECDERTISAGDNIIGLPKPHEPIDESMKDIATRKKVEEFRPETSDHKTRKDAVSDPLKEKTDPKFKAILDRGPKEQDKRAKSDQRKMAAKDPFHGETDTTMNRLHDTNPEAGENEDDAMGKETTTHEEQEKVMAAATDPHGDVDTSLNRNFDPNPEPGEGEHDAWGKEDTVHEEQELLSELTGDSLSFYATRMRRGEAPEKVLTEIASKVRKAAKQRKTASKGKIRWAFKNSYADVGVGDTVSVQTSTGLSNVKIDMVGTDNQGKPTLIGKDNTNQVRSIPSGTQVTMVQDPTQTPGTVPQTSTTQTQMPAASTPTSAPVPPVA